MAAPIYPKGYEPLEDVYSGNVPDEPRGVINTHGQSVAAFFYRHSINRLGLGTLIGFTTIQIRESDAPGAKILFEQSFLLGVQDAGPVWYLIESYTYKFKTRICNGEFVPPVVESIAPQAEDGTAPKPGNPGLPLLHNVRVTTLDAQMPGLPARATSLSLLWAPAQGGGDSDPTGDPSPDPASFQVYASGLKSDEIVTVDVADLGISSETEHIAPTEKVWLRLEAVGPGGTTLGAAIRDVWTFQQGNELVAGYQGYLYADTQVVPPQDADAYYEESYFLNVGSSGLGFITADWISPFYKCALPVGAFMEIVSDYWVSVIRDDDIYFALSWRPGQGDVELHHHENSDDTWFVYTKDGALRCAYQRQVGTLVLAATDALIASVSPSKFGSVQQGAYLYCFYETTALSLSVSYDWGQNWQEVTVALDGLTMISKPQIAGDGGALFLLCQATADDATNGIAKGDLVSVTLHLNADTTTPFEVSRTPVTVKPDPLSTSGALYGLALTDRTFYLAGQVGTGVSIWRGDGSLENLQQVTP